MKRLTTIIITIFISAFSSFSIASPKIKFITLEVEPWAYFDKEKNVYAGIFPALLKEIEAYTDYDIEFSVAPFGFSRINRELISNRRDCTILIVQKHMSDHLILGESVMSHAMGVFPQKKHELSEYKDLFGLKISVHKALVTKHGFLNDNSIIKDFDSSYVMGLNKIQHSRVDAVAGAISTIEFLAKKMDVFNDLGRPLIVKSEPVRLQCSKEIKEFEYFKKINDAILYMKKKGIMKKIIEVESASYF